MSAERLRACSKCLRPLVTNASHLLGKCMHCGNVDTLGVGAQVFCTCGAVAYIVARRVYRGDRLMAEDVRRPSGAELRNGDLLTCESCGALVSGISIESDGTGRLLRIARVKGE